MVLDSGQSSSGTLQIAIDEDPNAAFFKNRVRSYVRATVCGNCGYTEFYAGLPQELYQAYQNMLKNMEE